ncbi:GAF domain-containing sensor histidine kinase [Sphingobacterium multivorum]|uniref:GAF domain-containing sensor histidine kinase n=1 Tax=Sphingobacterium multivorum TaxID=28454 RepID=UPI0028AEF9E3|nr:GAF domain-containing sensor histidine kinase [Sphingobacterium multivorum]
MKENKDSISHLIIQIEDLPAIKDILNTICLYTGMDLGLVTSHNGHQWIACAVKDSLGIGVKAGQQLELHYTLGDPVHDRHAPIIIPDIERCENEDWKRKLHAKGFKSYIAFPIVDNEGFFFGTLCTIDYKAVPIDTQRITPLFKLLSELITFHLDSIAKVRNAESLLGEELQYSKRRDTLLSVLGHDLKNPLSAVITLSQYLADKLENVKHKQTATLIYDSSYRMKALIDNILDFARSKLGAGIHLNKNLVELDMVILQTLREIQTSAGDRKVLTYFGASRPVKCDHERMAQVFSNLIGNSVRHGSAEHKIVINSSIESDKFIFQIENDGDEIEPPIFKNLFKPFVRGKNKKEGGLGLGLYISKQIITAHKGEIQAKCIDGKVIFSLWIPIE